MKPGARDRVQTNVNAGTGIGVMVSGPVTMLAQQWRTAGLTFAATQVGGAAPAMMGMASAATWTFGQDLLNTVGGHGQNLATIAWIVLGAGGTLVLTMAASTAALAAAPRAICSRWSPPAHSAAPTWR